MAIYMCDDAPLKSSARFWTTKIFWSLLIVSPIIKALSGVVWLYFIHWEQVEAWPRWLKGVWTQAGGAHRPHADDHVHAVGAF